MFGRVLVLPTFGVGAFSKVTHCFTFSEYDWNIDRGVDETRTHGIISGATIFLAFF